MWYMGGVKRSGSSICTGVQQVAQAMNSSKQKSTAVLYYAITHRRRVESWLQAAKTGYILGFCLTELFFVWAKMALAKLF